MTWRPIDTAPKDNTAIDIWSQKNGRLTDYKRVDMRKGNVFYDPVYSGVTTVRDATHWMPIPEAPK